jgi:hypothetical protein
MLPRHPLRRSHRPRKAAGRTTGEENQVTPG